MQQTVASSLGRLDVPDASAARERAWTIVEAAFTEHRPQPRPHRRLTRVAVALVGVLVVVGAVVSPPGRAVVDRVREAVGIEHAQPALFRFPVPGRVLVASDAGIWVVQPDGAKRLLGRYREASWSPFGRFVVAARSNELAALEPDGDVRWTLARPGVRSPLWSGSPTDTRIAYLDTSGIRVVGGDGRGDRLLSPEPAPIGWRPVSQFVLGELHGSELRLQDARSGQVLGRRRAGPAGDVMGWSWAPDGRRAVVVHPSEVTIVDAARNIVRSVPFRGGDVVAAAVSPNGHELAVLREGEVVVLDVTRPSARRRVLAGAGSFDALTWSPDGRWLVVTWPAADQWVFVRTDGKRIRAVSNISAQFRSRTFPRIEGWCCP